MEKRWTYFSIDSDHLKIFVYLTIFIQTAHYTNICEFGWSKNFSVEKSKEDNIHWITIALQAMNKISYEFYFILTYMQSFCIHKEK
jgi:hypothetical protein